MKILFRYSLPAALLGAIWLTMRTTVLAGSEGMVSTGFPFAWLAPDPSSSMAFTVAWGPALLDLALWLAVCHVLLASVARRRGGGTTRPMAASIAASIALWLGAALSVAYLAVSVSMSPRFVPWTLDSYFDASAKRERSFQLGPLPAPAS